MLSKQPVRAAFSGSALSVYYPCQHCCSQTDPAVLASPALRAREAQTLVAQAPECLMDNGQTIQGMFLIFILHTNHIYSYLRTSASKTKIALTPGF